MIGRERPWWKCVLRVEGMLERRCSSVEAHQEAVHLDEVVPGNHLRHRDRAGPTVRLSMKWFPGTTCDTFR